MLQRGFIFPRIGSMMINKNLLEFPSCVLELYINKYMDQNLKSILLNWLQNKNLSDNEYKLLAENSFASSKADITFSGDIFNMLGLELLDIENFEIAIISDRLEDIKTDTFDECLLNILNPIYNDILREEFPDYTISLGTWKSNFEPDLQSLNSTLRSAYKFTLFEYIYGDKASSYKDFESFFIVEFWKRAHLVKNIWETRNGNDSIEYIPIFENLRNYNLSQKTSVVKALKTILDSEFIQVDDKEEVKNHLYDQISDSIQSRDREALNIQNDILQPVISKQINWEKAVETLNSAKVLLSTKDYAGSVNRSYYSMLYCVRSMMSEKGILNHYKNRTLSPNEDHGSVESGLKTLIGQGVLSRGFLNTFQDVKDSRWIADYSDKLVDSGTASDCVRKAEKLKQKTESIINYKQLRES